MPACLYLRARPAALPTASIRQAGTHIGLRRKQQVLPLLAPRLLALLVAGHDAVPRLGALLNLRVLNLRGRRKGARRLAVWRAWRQQAAALPGHRPTSRPTSGAALHNTRGSAIYCGKHSGAAPCAMHPRTWNSRPRVPVSASNCLVTRYPGRPMRTVFLMATRRCGAGATGFSAASRAARLARFCWWRLPAEDKGHGGCAGRAWRGVQTARAPATHCRRLGCRADACEHPTLRVRQVVALVCVQGQTQAALVLRGQERARTGHTLVDSPPTTVAVRIGRTSEAQVRTCAGRSCRRCCC